MRHGADEAGQGESADFVQVRFRTSHFVEETIRHSLQELWVVPFGDGSFGDELFNDVHLIKMGRTNAINMNIYICIYIT